MTNRFELLEELGRGGMGTVWKARNSETGEVVALKLLNSNLADDPDALRRFQREADIASRLMSPTVVRVVGFGRHEGQPYLAMEYVDGESLREKIRREAPMSWRAAQPIIRDIAEALDAAHRAGVVHRDIKPANVLLESSGRARVADFGIARAMDQTALTGSSTVLGTPLYMAPEAEITPLSDLYGLGCAIYEMLAGAPPFDGATHQQVWLRHLTDSADLSRLPEEARALVAWLLQKDPKHRTPSAEQVLRVLDGTLKAPRPSVVAQRTNRSRKVLAASITTALLLLTGLGMFALLRGEDDGNLTKPRSAQAEQFANSASAHATPDAEVATKAGTSTDPSPTPTESTAASASNPSAPATAGAATAAPTPTASATLAPTPTPTRTPTSTPLTPATSALTAFDFQFYVARPHEGEQYNPTTDCDRSRPAGRFRPGLGEGMCLDWSISGVTPGKVYTIKREIRLNGGLVEEFTFSMEFWNGPVFNSTPQSAPGTYVWTWLFDGVPIGSGTVTVP